MSVSVPDPMFGASGSHGANDSRYMGTSQYEATLYAQKHDNGWNQFWGNLTGRYSRDLASALRADAKNSYTAAREDSTYQRQIEDMKLAGINPMLANYSASGPGVAEGAQGGDAASSGVGSGMITALGGIIAAVASKAVGAKMLKSALAQKTAAGAANSIARNAVASRIQFSRMEKALFRNYNRYFRR